MSELIKVVPRMVGGHTIYVDASTYHVAKESGELLYICCGSDDPAAVAQRKAGSSQHPHYFGFTHDLYAHDGKYLTRIGHKVS